MGGGGDMNFECSQVAARGAVIAVSPPLYISSRILTDAAYNPNGAAWTRKIIFTISSPLLSSSPSHYHFHHHLLSAAPGRAQEELFERMCAWDDTNFIMGAGTKAGSDKNKTDGIVDGHAYSVIQARQRGCLM